MSSEQGLVPCVTTDEVSVELLQYYYFMHDFEFKFFVYLQHNMCMCTFSVIDGYSSVLSCSWNCIIAFILSDCGLVSGTSLILMPCFALYLHLWSQLHLVPLQIFLQSSVVYVDVIQIILRIPNTSSSCE